MQRNNRLRNLLTVPVIMARQLKRNALSAGLAFAGNATSNEFDEHLQNEVEREREIQKKKKIKRTQSKKSPDLINKSTFQSRTIGSKKEKHRQLDPEYEIVIDGPLRKIKPYHFTYRTFCKERWRDKKLVDVFISEFRDRESEYYKRTIENGDVHINDETADLSTVIRNGDLITHQVHRHEPPVTSRPIKVIFEDDNIMVIDKPSGIPVHPTGRYRFNTITKMLQNNLGFVVNPCNRLDRLTSGLMFLAKTPKGADDIGDQLKAREVTKEYVAKVVGEFPETEVIVEKPLKLIEPRLALNAVCQMDEKGAKHAKTVFNRISYDGKTSIVKCKPLTGRSHQIRVHLQYLGHPIANDPIYSNDEVWGNNLGKGGQADFDIVITRLDEIGKRKPAKSWFHGNGGYGEVLRQEKCSICESDLYTDPGPNDLDLWLHAYLYESTETEEGTGKKKWCYKTEYPEWALGT
ncbi:CCQ_1a_G0008360.mRNA.1.CDS.1 [Saccharomyces cerevisiae]|nr:CCQ_1a_G0008360.mRNA.1.CDS.1 [Saccharomyces cerevisiae]CAI7188632.1 CCQ_1a_G0008360.mRNA.1.CDS.1 [Saccharomyces cerevisiae]